MLNSESKVLLRDFFFSIVVFGCNPLEKNTNNLVEATAVFETAILYSKSIAFISKFVSLRSRRGLGLTPETILASQKTNQGDPFCSQVFCVTSCVGVMFGRAPPLTHKSWIARLKYIIVFVSYFLRQSRLHGYNSPSLWPLTLSGCYGSWLVALPVAYVSQDWICMPFPGKHIVLENRWSRNVL